MVQRPKFALHEKVDIPGFEVQVRKTGLKLRWDHRRKKEKGNRPLSSEELEKEVKESTYWWKGSFNVDFLKEGLLP